MSALGHSRPIDDALTSRDCPKLLESRTELVLRQVSASKSGSQSRGAIWLLLAARRLKRLSVKRRALRACDRATINLPNAEGAKPVELLVLPDWVT
jgi:hypothetical protein